MAKSNKTVSKKKPTKKSGTKKNVSKKTTVKNPTKVQESVVQQEPVKRTKPTKESTLQLIDDLTEAINQEIVERRNKNDKVKGIRFLRSINKSLKKIRSHGNRVMKTKNKKPRKVNENSGFLKPVKISKELSTFTKNKPNDLVSRVDVTKYICNYIKENNLQNPEDKRQILPDSKLSKLLNYDSKTADKPLTYFRIQSLMKDHFIK